SPPGLPPPAAAPPIRPAPATASPENRRRAFPPPLDRRRSISRGSPDKRARWRLVRKRGTWLFHHLGDDEEVILVGRRIGDDGIRDAAIGHLVVAHFHRHRRHRRHR